jgi:hypothetical protein
MKGVQRPATATRGVSASLSSRELQEMVPKLQVATACFSGSPPGLNSSKVNPLHWRLPHYRSKLC